MRPVDDIRDGLITKGGHRLSLLDKVKSLEHDLGELLGEAKSHPQITMSEAAALAKVERTIAYRLMAKVGGSGA